MDKKSRRIKKPTVAEAVLEAVKEGLYTTAEVIDMCLSIYPESYKKARAAMLGREYRKREREPRRESDYVLRKRLYSQISYLRKKGFIEKNELTITEKGKRKLEKLKEKIGLPQRNYDKIEDGKLKVIIFDIPEKEKAKRDWLRTRLDHMGFTILQKSVWIGKAKLPEEFLEDLELVDIRSRVHIFRISKEDAGTIQIS